jgi:predicted metal-dependent peptidase
MSAVITPGKKTKSDKFDNLVGPTDGKVDHLARERLMQARIVLLMSQSFFGNLATRMKMVNADEWCSTAATDGQTLYYNSRFIMLLRPKEVEFLVAHEVLHVVYDHIGRRETRDPQIWNVAGDYAVNADLKRHKVGEFITSVPCLYEKKYDGKSAEEIYEDLMKNVTNVSMEDLIEQLLDEHMDSDMDSEGDGESSGKGRSRPKMSAGEREKMRQEMKQAIINAASDRSGAGTIPKNVERLIQQVTSPVMPWRELLDVNVSSAIRNDYSWTRVNRRGWDMDAIMPGMTPGEEIEVTVAVDMSGSISDKQATLFLTEIGGMMSAFSGYKVHVFCFDTSIYNPADFSSENMEDIGEYKPCGGGGTNFDCIFDYLKENAMEPKRLIVFTDGMPYGSWGDKNYTDVTWIIHGSKDIIPPWGTWAYFDEKA